MGIGNLLPGFRGRVKEVAQAMPSVETLGRGVPAAGIPPTRRQSIGNEEFRYTSPAVVPACAGSVGRLAGDGAPGELASRGFGSPHHRRPRSLPPLHQSTGNPGLRYASPAVAPPALGRGVYLLALPPDFLSPPPALGAWGGSPGTGPPGSLLPGASARPTIVAPGRSLPFTNPPAPRDSGTPRPPSPRSRWGRGR